MKERSPFKLVEMLKIQCSQSCIGESAHCYGSVVDKNIKVNERKKPQNKIPAVILMSRSPRKTFSPEVKLKDYLGVGGGGHLLYWK